MRLTPEETAHALGLAAQFAAGLSQVWEEGSAEYPLQLGFPARNGILAARAAKAGVTAAREMLEGRGGFYRAYADTTEPAREILEGLGKDWQLSEVTVKMYPVCAILQGPVGSMVQLARAEALHADAVEQIEIRLNPFEASYAGIDNPGPFASPTATKMSAQFSLAASLLDRRLTLTDLSRLTDPAITTLAQRVRVVSDPDIAPRLSELNVRTRDGRVLTNSVTAPVGQPEIAEICDFARMLAPEAGMTAEAMDKVTRQICALRTAKSLAPLFDALGHV
jgi:2-methylcitrate dehydratase PrpD